MDSQHKVYIANIGIISAIGDTAAMNAASVKAGISGYKVSDFYNQQQQPITLASLPDELLAELFFEMDEGAYYSDQYERILTMALFAVHEALHQQPVDASIPVVLAIPEMAEQGYSIPADLLLKNLLKQKALPLKVDAASFIATGRAAGIHGLQQAFDYLYQKGASYVLLGGSDSYINTARIDYLDENERLLVSNRMDSFVAGEGAGFLLLTRDRHKAMQLNNHVVALYRPGLGEEQGHMYSDEPYCGDGLADAFRQALSRYTGEPVKVIYSSMNGEHIWAKEYGVACLRNRHALDNNVQTEHPADCYGDLGAATGSVLIGVAAIHLLQNRAVNTQLVYASADRSQRAAVVMEKISL